jgi:hypothetical protein
MKPKSKPLAHHQRVSYAYRAAGAICHGATVISGSSLRDLSHQLRRFWRQHRHVNPIEE